ncbi:MAG: iron-containing alcohol dehydrogenase [Firmicutes bacterium]|nr:iron-containing alcohol dehydrogenase [Bacillota bacterium]
MRQLQGLVELDADSGGVRLNHAALPRAAERVVFGRCLATHVLPDAVMRLVDPANRSVLLVVGESSSKAPEIAALLDKLRRLADNGTAALRLEVLEVRGHADHHAIRAGIAAVRRSGAGLVVAIGGGTTIDVGKSVAALAYQEDERGTDAFRGRGTGEATGVSANVTKGMGWTADTATGGVGTGGEASAGTAAHSPAGSARAGFQRVATARAHADASADAGTGVGQSRTMPAQPDADVGPAVAADENMDAETEVDVDIAAYQLGRRRVAPERALPWIAVPTTSGTGSESTDNAVIELGDEKKSLRGIPAPRLIIADPALTDSLPLAPTVGAAVDALAQSLEVLTNSAASAEVQEVALAAFATLARGIEDLYLVATRRIGETGSDSGKSDDPAAQGGPEDLAHPGQRSDTSARRSLETAPVIRDAGFQRGCGAARLSLLNPVEPDHPVEPGLPVESGKTSQASQHDRFDSEDHPPRVNPSPRASERPASAMLAASSTSAAGVAATTRDTLCWGSFLMGIAFAHARLGLPHALVHFCNRFGLSHGNMVGMLLAPGLAVQARDPETARRLARAAQALDRVLRCREVPAPEGTAPESRISQTSVVEAASLGVVVPKGLVPSRSELLFRWLETRIPALFAATGLPHSLRAAGLTRADLDWIVARELESRPSFGTPVRPATPGDLKEVLEKAFDTR